MTSLVAMVRRSLWVLVLVAAGGAAYGWWRDRSAPDDLAPAEWPPLTSTPSPPASTTPTSQPTEASAAPDSASSTPSLASAASVVNALVDAPEARSADGGNGGWVPPLDDGSCPLTHPIKANDNSGIFHVPDGRFYERTNPERCYTTPEAATADGYRQAKN